MILSIAHTALVSLRRDRGALALSFILPIAFFSIFAVIFGGRHDGVTKIKIILVDEDHSSASQRLVNGFTDESSLTVLTQPSAKNGVPQPMYNAASAEAAVKAGVVPVALIIPEGFGKNPISFSGGESQTNIQMLKDPSDVIAPQAVSGLLQKVAIASLPDLMVAESSKYMSQYVGGLTPEQNKKLNANLESMRHQQGAQSSGEKLTTSELLPVKARDVVGASKNESMIPFYAAATGVMFLLFTASGAAGSLLDEAENGTLDRVLSSRVTMTTLLAGKLLHCTMLAFSQLVLMFVWGWAVFKLDLFSHIPGFVVMGLSTAFAVGAFGMLPAGACRTRAQLGALSTLVILIMSSIGGSMFPRYLMPVGMQKAGLFTINAWAIDGFTKVFWRGEPITHLWPQVSVLLVTGVVLFVIARKLARRWEYC